jgi:hypothetical protein
VFQSADVGYVVVLYRNQQVTGFDTCLLAGTVSIYALGTQMAAFFYPPNAIVRGRIFAVLLKINAGEDDRSYAKQRQENREKACLQVSVHRSRGLVIKTDGWDCFHRPLFYEQLRCHVFHHGSQLNLAI